MFRARWGTAILLCAASAAAADDVVTLRDGERIEGLIVEADATGVMLRWGAGRAVITRRLARREIASVRFSQPDVDGLRELARRSEAQGEVNDAAEVLQVLCGLRPDSAEDQLRRARNLRLAGRTEDALAAARTALRLDPEDPRLHVELGEIRLALRDFRGAAQCALDAVKRGGTAFTDGPWLLGRAFEGSSLTDDAVGAYRQVLQIDPTHVRALERLVDVHIRRQTPADAEAAARAFIRAAPDVRAGRVALGMALYCQGRYGEAVDAFRAATSLGGAAYDRARVFLQCARARSADTEPADGLTAAELEVACELDPDLRRKP